MKNHNDIETLQWVKLPKSTGWYFAYTPANSETSRYMIKKINPSRFEAFERSETIPGLWNFVTAGLTLQRTKNQMVIYHNAKNFGK